MRTPRWSRWLPTCALAIAIAGPAFAQSLAPDPATPETPNNPFSPPPCTGAVFTDVTCSTTFDSWIEQFAADAITGGCGGGAYCPTANVTRAQMAVFVEKAMRGTGAWSPGDLGNDNTGLGASALLHNTTASRNTAIGSRALMTQSFDGGASYFTHNTAVGARALENNQPSAIGNGHFNTAIGSEALLLNETGSDNTAVGVGSLQSNTTAS